MGVDPQTAFEQLVTGVLSQMIWAWYPPERVIPKAKTPSTGLEQTPGQDELTTVAVDSQFTVQMYAIPPVQ